MTHQEMFMLFLAFAKMFGVMAGIALLAFVLMLRERHKEIMRMHVMRKALEKDIADQYQRVNKTIEKGTKLP